MLFSPRDLDFIEALRAGETARGYAIRNHYHPQWAKWEAKKIKQKLGASTLEEAIRLSEITAEDVAAIRREQRELKEALARLEAASTPKQKADAREDVRDARADLDAELKSRGLTREDLDKLQEEKEYERFKTRQDRLESEKAAERKAKRKPSPTTAASKTEDDEDDSDDDEPTPVEEPPKSNHWAEKKLWGKSD